VARDHQVLRDQQAELAVADDRDLLPDLDGLVMKSRAPSGRRNASRGRAAAGACTGRSFSKLAGKEAMEWGSPSWQACAWKEHARTCCSSIRQAAASGSVKAAS